MSSRTLVAAVVVGLLSGSGSPVGCRRASSEVAEGSGVGSSLKHQAYVWQRRWTDPVREAVATADADLTTLHVLVRDESGPERGGFDIGVDVKSLTRAHRPIVAVVRLDGRRSIDGVSLQNTVDRLESWQREGVDIGAIEVDDDCPSARLADYAEWLRKQRPIVGTRRLGITALPSWIGAPALSDVAAAVDDLTLQVHAIRAPTLFDPQEAEADIAAFSRSIGRRFAVALPTYRVQLRDGSLLESDPGTLSEFVRRLDPAIVSSVVWFRLGHADDREAWSRSTAALVRRGQTIDRRLDLGFRVSSDGSSASELVVANPGNVDATAPTALDVGGSIEFLDGLNGYRTSGTVVSHPHPPLLRPGQSVPVATARGTELSVVSMDPADCADAAYVRGPTGAGLRSRLRPCLAR